VRTVRPSAERAPSDRGRAPGRGGADPGRGAFPQALWLGGTVAALVFAILLLGSAWFRAETRERGRPARGGASPVAGVPVDVDLWIGEPAEGVKVVLSSEWGEPVADARYDAEMNRDLGVPAGSALAYYRLTVFNAGVRPVTLSFKDGAVVVTPMGGEPLPMKSLASVLEAAAGPVSQTLRWLGADRLEVEIPAGRRHSHPIALARRVPLSQVASVAREDGTAFRLRRIKGAAWSALLSTPSLDDVKGL
jgi:hypothetical protein